MKKGLIVLFIISTFFPCIANATYHLNAFYVQNRVYENGNHQNRVYFDCVDAFKNYPTTDILGAAVLTDPNGKNVKVEFLFSGSYLEVDGSYNASNGQWIWQNPYQTGGYSANFSDKLITGKYHLDFIDKAGEASGKDFVINKIVDLPIIPTSSYSLHLNQAGDLIWQWQVPDYIDPSLQTSARAWIDIFDDQKKLIGEFYVSIPTQMGFLVVPKTGLEYILSVGKTFHLGTQIRTNDNNNRSYSTGVGNN
ncbi:MAG: hypothetical protein V1844_02555 [Pseudomonadota bacterium]